MCYDPELLKEMVLLFDDVCFMHHPEHARQLMEGIRSGAKKPLFAPVEEILSGLVDDYDLLVKEGAVSFSEDLKEFRDQCRKAIIDPNLAGVTDGSLQRGVAKLWRGEDDSPSPEY